MAPFHALITTPLLGARWAEKKGSHGVLELRDGDGDGKARHFAPQVAGLCDDTIVSI